MSEFKDLDSIFKNINKFNDDIASKDKNGDTLLHLAIKNKCDIQILGNLLKFGADINAQNNRGYTPLHTAISEKNFIGAYFLVKNNAKLEITDQNEYSALCHSIFCRQFNITYMLIKENANINQHQVLYAMQEIWDDDIDLSYIFNLLIKNGLDIGLYPKFFVKFHMNDDIYNKIKITLNKLYIKPLLEIEKDECTPLADTIYQFDVYHDDNNIEIEVAKFFISKGANTKHKSVIAAMEKAKEYTDEANIAKYKELVELMK